MNEQEKRTLIDHYLSAYNALEIAYEGVLAANLP